MTKKHFAAILAKNEIARELRDSRSTGELGMTKVSTAYILSCLRDIEDFIGQDNLPGVDDIINCDKYNL